MDKTGRQTEIIIKKSPVVEKQSPYAMLYNSFVLLSHIYSIFSIFFSFLFFLLVHESVPFVFLLILLLLVVVVVVVFVT